MDDQFVRVYDYNDAPTLKRFNEDKRFFRVIIGPYGCLPANTQFLSPHGWKNISEYSGEKVAQWDKDSNTISFINPSKHIKLPCDNFIRFDSGSLVMELSEEHRVPHYDWNGKFQVKTAAQIANDLSEIKIPTIPFVPEGTDDFSHIHHRYDKCCVTISRNTTKISIVKSIDGSKYCFAVPSGFFVARCEGTIFITGNSGKSSACVAEIIDIGVNQAPNQNKIRKTRWAVVRSTYRMLYDTTMATFFQWLPPEYFGNFNVTNYTYSINKIALDDGTKVEIEIIFRALDKPEHVRNLLSLELTGAWFNEIRETPKVIVDNMEGRVNRYPSKMDGGATWAGIIADTNPPDTDSWLYKLFEEQVPKDTALQEKYALFKQPSGRSDKAENLSNLPENYYANMAVGKDSEFIKVYVDGEYGYIRDGKPVFSNYIDSMHCAEEAIMPIKSIPVIIGLDFGLSPAAVFCQYLPKGQFHVIHEIISEDVGIRRFFNDTVKPYIFANLRGYELVIVGDPAGVRRQDTDERSCFDELRMIGYPATPAHTNSFLARYNAVDTFLTKTIDGKPAFQLSPTCQMLRKGFLGEYKLKKFQGLNDRYSEIPVKNEYSHIHDALQYASMVVDRAAIIERSRNPMDLRYNRGKLKTNKPSLAAWT